jgi:hypothetical protein
VAGVLKIRGIENDQQHARRRIRRGKPELAQGELSDQAEILRCEGRPLADMVSTWVNELKSESGGRMGGWPPRNQRDQLISLLSMATAAFCATLLGVEGRSLLAAASQYRFLTEGLALARWLAEPDMEAEREARSESLNVEALRRLSRLMQMLDSDETFSAQRPMYTTLQNLLGDRLQAANTTSRPARSQILGLLPGSHATFAGLSEIFSHPGPSPALLLEGATWTRTCSSGNRSAVPPSRLWQAR